MTVEGDLAGGSPELRIAVLLSGTGRTLENLNAAIAGGQVPARVVAVVSSRAAVRGNDVARAAGLPLTVLPRRRFAGVEEFSDAVYRALSPHAVDLVVLAGFLSQLTIPERYRDRIMNIHPSLLPLFGGHGYWGERVHRAVLESGMKVSGCTVHFVDERYDAGPIILQRCVPVLEGDEPETLGARVFAEERRLYPEAIRLFAEGRLRVEGRRVRILPG
ncbi:MAG TPA: phosphoribosylglycinamide formyltransferase [Thermomicrobiaceae bacterium]|nr:phosphoribosylglycinamide formyltransferase [Thermomicrobiaceae bacterium]